MKCILSTLVLAPLVATAAIWSDYGDSYSTSGCGSPSPFPHGSFTHSTIDTVDGAREYGVWVPDNYDRYTKTKLIFSYHGANEDITNQRALDGLTKRAFNTDYLVVYLQGVRNAENDTTWQGAPGAPADDIAFTRSLLDRIESQFCIDSNKIYATGKSQGAGFVGKLACDLELSTRFAAFALVSGAYYNANITKKEDCHAKSMPIICSPGRKDVPILTFHGGADTTISYHGGFRKGACLPDVQYWVTEWAKRDGLDTSAADVHEAAIVGSDDGFNRTYGNGLVKLVYDGDNIPHDWPATFANSDNGGKHLAGFNATTWIMEFFNDHELQ